MNDEEFGSKKLLKLKYRRGDQIIQTFCKIGSPKKLGPPSLICRNFKTMRKPFLIHAEWTEIESMTKDLDLKNFKIKKQKRGPNNSEILQNWFLQQISSPSLIYTNLKFLRELLLNHAKCIES